MCMYIGVARRVILDDVCDLLRLCVSSIVQSLLTTLLQGTWRKALVLNIPNVLLGRLRLHHKQWLECWNIAKIDPFQHPRVYHFFLAIITSAAVGMAKRWNWIGRMSFQGLLLQICECPFCHCVVLDANTCEFMLWSNRVSGSFPSNTKTHWYSTPV